MTACDAPTAVLPENPPAFCVMLLTWETFSGFDSRETGARRADEHRRWRRLRWSGKRGRGIDQRGEEKITLHLGVFVIVSDVWGGRGEEMDGRGRGSKFERCRLRSTPHSTAQSSLVYLVGNRSSIESYDANIFWGEGARLFAPPPKNPSQFSKVARMRRERGRYSWCLLYALYLYLCSYVSVPSCVLVWPHKSPRGCCLLSIMLRF